MDRKRGIPHRLSLVLLSLMLIFIVSGCAAPQMADEAPREAPEEPAAPTTDEASAEERGLVADTKHVVAIASEVDDKKIIQNATISLEVRSPEETAAELQEEAANVGGYISNISETQLGDDRTRIQMTVRVPSEAFSDYRARAVALGTVTDSRVWTEDVTEEYIDLRARLDNLSSEEESLRRILNEAETIEDIMTVRRELTEVRGNIESLQGRLRYLQDRISYSTLNINIRPETLPGGAIHATGLDNLAPRLAQAFIRGSNWLLNAVGYGLITFTTALPTLLAAGAVLAILSFAVLRIRRRHQTMK